MNKPKPFDCVQMKWNIQEQLAREFAGVPEEEAQRRLNERVRADPILGPFLKQVQEISHLVPSSDIGSLPKRSAFRYDYPDRSIAKEVATTGHQEF